jgi:ABC-2 type transport system ATP-binding protein
MAILAIDNLSKSYGRKTVVNQVSMEIHPGEILGIIGPNGAGKSTILKAATGEIPFDKGSIVYSYDNTALPIARWEARKAFGYIPQDTLVYPYLTLREYLEFHQAVRPPIPSQTISNWLGLFDLVEDQEKLLSNFSYGMIRKTQLIAAMMGKPPLLILDEALNGLDLISLRRVQNLLEDWIAQERAAIIVSHQLDIIKAISTRLLIMKEGKIIQHLDTEAWKELQPNFESHYYELIRS